MKFLSILLLLVQLTLASDRLYRALEKGDFGIFEQEVRSCKGYDYVMPNGLPLIFYFVSDPVLKKYRESDFAIEATARLLLCYYRDDLDFERLFRFDIEKYFGTDYFKKIKAHILQLASSLRSKEELRYVAKFLGESSLPHFVVKINNISLMRQILNKKNINTKDSKGYKPFHYARSKKALKLLVDLGADIYEKTEDGKNLLLTYVSTYSSLDTNYLRYLIHKKKFDPTSTDNQGNTALHLVRSPQAFCQIYTTFGKKLITSVNHDAHTPLDIIVEKEGFAKAIYQYCYIPYLYILRSISIK